MQAVLLVGGFGTRLSSVINNLPKPMAPVIGKPFLEYLLLLLKRNGIDRFVFCTGYLDSYIKEHFGDGINFGVSILYSSEISPLYSGGALKLAEELLDEDFFVVNGDDYLDIDYKKLFSYHKNQNSLITLAVRDLTGAAPFHTLLLDKNKVIRYYGAEVNYGNKAFTGISVVNKKVLYGLETNKPISLEKDIFDKYAKLGLVSGYFQNGYWIDIGLLERYRQFIEDVKRGVTK